MKDRKVVSAKNLPMQPPWQGTLLAWLVLDHFHAPGIAYGVVLTIVVLLWVVWIIGLFCTTPVELFKD